MKALAAARMMVLVFSRHTQGSGQVRREVERAASRDIPILPVRIEDVRPENAFEYFLSSSHWMDAPPPFDRHLPELTRTARAVLGLSGPAAPESSAPPVPPRVVARPAVAAVARPPAAPPRTFTNSIGMEFVRIEAGTFLMGSPPGEVGRSDDEAQHRVRLTKPFFLGSCPVTQRQWQAVMGGNPSHFKGDDLPVETISWDDAMTFCRKLSQTEGRASRLPTEAEWEYACRAGTSGRYAGTGQLDDMGWHASNSESRTYPVSQKKANAWGLYDMHGNIWEWCQDCFGPYPSGDVTDPAGPANGMARIVRGGSWRSIPHDCRAAFRHRIGPAGRNFYIGFRVALDL